MAGEGDTDGHASPNGVPIGGPGADANFTLREQELFRLWNAKESWRGTVFLPYYYVPGDGRVVVRRQKRWAGWSFNLAHRWAWPIMAVSAILAFGPMFLMLALFRDSPVVALPAVLISGAVSLRLLVTGARHLSSQEY